MHAKTREKNKSKKDRLPKLTLQCVRDESVAECSFDTHRSARITFQFGIKEDAPEDIADKMVGFLCSTKVDVLLIIDNTVCKRLSAIPNDSRWLELRR